MQRRRKDKSATRTWVIGHRSRADDEDEATKTGTDICHQDHAMGNFLWNSSGNTRSFRKHVNMQSVEP